MELDQKKLEESVRILLEQENIGYVERIRSRLRGDEHYLFFHEVSTAMEVRQILWANGGGVYISDNADALLVLREALSRIPKTSAA